MNINPIRRSRIRKKAKKHRESWRSGKIRLNGKEMAALRFEVFDRTEGRCENSAYGKRCANRIRWNTMHMHHMLHRSLGGSDTRVNCLGICMDCHYGHHDGLWKIEPHGEWKP